MMDLVVVVVVVARVMMLRHRSGGATLVLSSIEIIVDECRDLPRAMTGKKRQQNIGFLDFPSRFSIAVQY